MITRFHEVLVKEMEQALMADVTRCVAKIKSRKDRVYCKSEFGYEKFRNRLIKFNPHLIVQPPCISYTSVNCDGCQETVQWSCMGDGALVSISPE